MHSRHVWSDVLVDYTEKKLIKCVLTSPTEEERRSWLSFLNEYRKGMIVVGWDDGHFTFHNVIKESR